MGRDVNFHFAEVCNIGRNPRIQSIIANHLPTPINLYGIYYSAAVF